MKAETYWERRCLMIENTLFFFMDIVDSQIPAVSMHTDSMRVGWDSALAKLDKEFEDGRE